MPVDLLISGGFVVMPNGRRRANVAVTDGRIVAVGNDRPAASQEVDASGLLVLPGGVDTHVHLMDPGSTEREDFPTGTGAAAAAGVTTIIEHSHGQPVRTVDDLRDKQDYLRGRANVDFGLAAHAWPSVTDVAALWQAGVAFFKVFTCDTHGIPGHDAAALRHHLTSTAMVDAMSLIHCEDDSITADAERLLRGYGRTDGGVLPEWRDRDAEVVAAAVTAILVRRTAARAVVAHVSHPEVAGYIQRERAAGARLGAEACPQYFLLREHEVHEHGALRKFTPPARARTDADEAELWRLLRSGTLTHMSTDHAPSTLEQKAAGDIWNVHFGLPGLDSTMPALLDACARGHLSFEDVARAYAETPARLYGLWPRKGWIGPGADADLLMVDPGHTWTLSNDAVLSKAGWTPFDGRRITGRVVRTYLRGRVVAEEGKPTGGRDGEFLRRDVR
ncbi:dihydroorotase (multifunctional complex type) [Kibdelosporangium banguiense]|uniref:Dihydroorotase (Multifunctional complex type) n=1 Tax=Kibdelosporangium banguiense TaxID=1365924 RepID=A0ABS4TVL7_9PSEU|nr:dihydroorotase family protein [Kibdelosporangium banguiense]MBP2328450.1 dihydroorotase (multifunctional complex type) [Kibdelosporangium banguiense]